MRDGSETGSTANVGSHHPASEQLQAFALGQLTEADQATVEGHLKTCDTCWEVVEETSRSDPLVQVLQSLTPQGQPPGVPSPSDHSARPPCSPNREAGPPLALTDHPRYRLEERLGA